MIEVFPMIRPDVVVVLDVLSLVAGLVLSGLLLVLTRRSSLRWPGTGLLVKSSVLWNFGGLAAVLLMISGVSQSHWTHSLASCVQAIGGALFPVSFVMAWSYPEPEEARQRTYAKWLLRAAIANAAVVAAIIVGICFLNSVPPAAKIFLPCSTAILLTVTSVLLVAGRVQATTDRIYLTLTLLGSWLASAGMCAIELATVSADAYRVLCLATTEAPFLIIAGALFFFARFRAADVLIKSSLRAVAALGLAWFGYSIITASYYFAPRVFFPPAVGRAIVITVLLFLLLLLFRFVDGLLIKMAERWILREPDYGASLRKIAAGIEALEAHDEIFAVVEKELTPFLEVAAVRVVECHHQRTLGTQPWEVGHDDPCRHIIPGHEADLLAPIRLRNEVPWAIAIAPGSCRRILLTKDLHFLQDVSGLVATRLESLAGERERAERQSREASLKHLAAVAELKALRAQINPHFLFNSLNTIADLIVSDPPKAETMTVLLASVFRHVLLHSDRHLTPICEEISFLRTYLRIEEVRFGERLLVDLDIQPSVAEHRIPSLLLQPIVENAIKHGLAPKVGPGKLRIAAHADGEFTRLEVEDDGVGLTTRGTNSRTSAGNGNAGVGLKNVADRLRMLYGGRAKLTCENGVLAGTLVTILIPVNSIAAAGAVAEASS
jgi:two-component system, LytTR family, sensor kinase